MRYFRSSFPVGFPLAQEKQKHQRRCGQNNPVGEVGGHQGPRSRRLRGAALIYDHDHQRNDHRCSGQKALKSRIHTQPFPASPKIQPPGIQNQKSAKAYPSGKRILREENKTKNQHPNRGTDLRAEPAPGVPDKCGWCRVFVVGHIQVLAPRPLPGGPQGRRPLG